MKYLGQRERQSNKNLEELPNTKLHYLHSSQNMSGDKIKDDEMGQACSMNRDEE